MHTAKRVRIWAMIETPTRDLQRARRSRRPRRCRNAALRLRHGHQRPRQGNARAASCRAAPRCCPGSPPASLAAREYGIDVLDGVYNDISNAEDFAQRVRAGARSRLRRQDADPSQPDRAVQCGLLAGAGRSRAGAQDDRRIRPAGEQGARAWCRSTAAWSSACMPRWRAARLRLRRRLRGGPRIAPRSQSVPLPLRGGVGVRVGDLTMKLPPPPRRASRADPSHKGEGKNGATSTAARRRPSPRSRRSCPS